MKNFGKLGIVAVALAIVPLVGWTAYGALPDKDSCLECDDSGFGHSWDCGSLEECMPGGEGENCKLTGDESCWNWYFGSCPDDACGAGNLLEELNELVDAGDVTAIAAFAAEHQEAVVYNRDRAALQINGCQKHLIASVSLVNLAGVREAIESSLEDSK